MAGGYYGSLPAVDIQLTRAERGRLQEALADTFNNQRAVEMILRSTDFPMGRIPSFENSNAHDVWGEILFEIDRGIIQAGTYQVLREAERRYQANQVFVELADTYLRQPADLHANPAQLDAAPAAPAQPDGPQAAAFKPTQAPAEAPACHVIIRASTEEDRERAVRALRDLGLDPQEQWSTAHAASYRVSSDRPDQVRAWLERPEFDFGWTVVEAGEADYLLRALYVEGPDGRRFRITDAPAQQTVGNLAAELREQYFDASTDESALVDFIGPDGLSRQLDPSLSLAEARLVDGVTVRVGWQSRRETGTPGGGRASTALETKVILVGEGAAGKTSLITAVGDSPFEESTRTHGIDIQSLVVRDPESGIPVMLRFWDFGGQPVYRVTHPLFFSANALYLVVWNARVGPEKDDVRGWVSRIVQRVGETAAIMLVATHHDEAPDAELDYAALEDEFPGLLRGEYRVDNKSRTRIPALRDAIARQAINLGRSLLPHWVKAANAIFEQSTDRPQISYEDFRATCDTYGLGGSDPETLAGLLHRQGRLIYQGDDEILRDLVILDPEWSSKAIGLILTDARTRNGGGVLDHGRLPELWQDRPRQYRYSRHHYSYLLRLMEKFDISYRMDDGRHSLITPLVSAIRPALPWDSQTPVPNGIRRLRLICRFSGAVPWLIPALTARLSSHGTKACWRSGVFLRYPVLAYASEALIELRHEIELSLEIRAPAPDLYLHVLQDSIQYLARQWPGLDIELRIPCPAEVIGGCPGQFRLERLLVARQSGSPIVTCPECPAEHQVAVLLTGFAQSAARDSEVQALLRDLRSGLDTVHLDIRSMQALAASSAADLRRLLTTAGTEITDCPRLFTVTSAEPEGVTKAKFWQLHFRLTLWCESPGQCHPCPEGRYSLDKDKKWARNAIRYARPVLTALRMAIPAAGALAAIAPASTHLPAAKEELDRMQKLLDAFPDDLPDDKDWTLPDDNANKVPASGANLRYIRQMLHDVDRYQHFGGLSRIQAESGEYLWLCPAHRTASGH